jgi:hypothetical protein
MSPHTPMREPWPWKDTAIIGLILLSAVGLWLAFVTAVDMGLIDEVFEWLDGLIGKEGA